MALSIEYTEWHLTPRGWERGTTRYDNGDETVRPRPADAALSCTYREEVGAMGADMQKSCEENRRSHEGARVAELLKQFGSCPEKL